MLPQKNRRHAESCDRFLNEYKLYCLISSSVKEKALDLLSCAHKYVLEELQENLLPYLDEKGIEKITTKDCLIFEDFFYVQRKKMKAKGKTNIYYELIGQIEQWVTEKVHGV